MEVNVAILDESNNKVHKNIDCKKFQKMVLLFNSLEEGWSIKKKEESYIFSKKHEGKKEVFEDAYLLRFMKTNLDLSKISL
jgi:hypothetical protein